MTADLQQPFHVEHVPPRGTSAARLSLRAAAVEGLHRAFRQVATERRDRAVHHTAHADAGAPYQSNHRRSSK